MIRDGSRDGGAMSDLYRLSDAQMAQLAPFLPKSHGKPRADDRRVPGGMICASRALLEWVPQQGGTTEYTHARTRSKRAKPGSTERVLSLSVMLFTSCPELQRSTTAACCPISQAETEMRSQKNLDRSEHNRKNPAHPTLPKIKNINASGDVRCFKCFA